MNIQLSGKKRLQERNKKIIERHINRNLIWSSLDKYQESSDISIPEHNSILNITHRSGIKGNILIYDFKMEIDIEERRNSRIDWILE